MLIVFDLDGTLVDSAPGILGCFGKVLDELSLRPQVPLTASLIGPPLAQTLAALTGVADEAALTAMTEMFKRHYDTEGYRATLPYPGVADLLPRLRNHGYRLALATNKRIVPTRLLLEHLKWTQWFGTVASLDSFRPKLPDKTAVLHAVLQQERADPVQTLYVGDKIEDAHAAEANGMRFAAASWGYGEFPDASMHWAMLDAPSEMEILFELAKE